MKFHITWFENPEDVFSKGETFEALDEVGALQSFREKYPTAIFLSCVSSDLLNLKSFK